MTYIATLSFDTGMDMFEKEVELEGEKVKMYIW